MARIRELLAQAEEILGFAEAHPSTEPRCLKLMAGLELAVGRARGLMLEQRRAARESDAGIESGRREHARATTELRRISRKISWRVEWLVSLNQVRFEDYPERLAAWKAKRRLLQRSRHGNWARGPLRLIS